ncbi:MAG: Lrp/AsnC family transcriptional regulator [Promethearchaeota archaeon]
MSPRKTQKEDADGDAHENFSEFLKIDETDKKIIALLQKDPGMTHSKIAEKVGKSQPAVGARIIKLKRKHLLSTQLGVNFKEVPVKLAKVELSTKNVSAVLTKLEHCPLIINCFKISGGNNLLVLVCAPNISIIDDIVDLCFRSDPNVGSVTTTFIISAIRNFVLPISFEIERYKEYGCGPNCFLNRGKNPLWTEQSGEKLKREDYREVIDDD